MLVGYDWGGVLALDWARRQPERVRGVVVFETFLRPMKWSDFPPTGAEFFRALRTPGVGEELVLEENGFLARSLENGVRRGLTEADREAYYAPFPSPASRRPLLQWPREIPIEGEPADVAAVVARNAEWLARSPSIPKLLLTFDGVGLSNAPAVAEWVQGTRSEVLGRRSRRAAGNRSRKTRSALQRLPGEIDRADGDHRAGVLDDRPHLGRPR